MAYELNSDHDNDSNNNYEPDIEIGDEEEIF